MEYALHLCSRDVIKWHLNEVIFEFTAGLGSQASCELSNMSRTEVKNSGMDELPGGRVYVCCNFAFSVSTPLCSGCDGRLMCSQANELQQ